MRLSPQQSSAAANQVASRILADVKNCLSGQYQRGGDGSHTPGRSGSPSPQVLPDKSPFWSFGLQGSGICLTVVHAGQSGKLLTTGLVPKLTYEGAHGTVVNYLHP